ncbi:hypothetical protein [Maribacter stanieri]|jgi:hypothetical protein|uniref:hypothetical protein n=1 Tax=Maribacter stanieri TaxID=440514 RepID=UPI002493D05D|nr:hypothetical protein [Maribacter stanieri]|tara:strand:+ start:2312 stop:2872 length:561 start_codon:yes stop_codon:yes gene_type:complete
MENMHTESLLGTRMNIESALLFIRSLVSETRPVNITPEHKMAYRVLEQTIYPSEDLLFDNNRPFANLYTHCSIQFANRYNVNIDDPLLQRELHRIIDQPFHIGVERLTSNMNDRMRNKLLDPIYPMSKFFKTLTIQERDEIFSNLEKSLKLSCNHDAFMGKSWSYEEVDRGLKSSIKKVLVCNKAN